MDPRGFLTSLPEFQKVFQTGMTGDQQFALGWRAGDGQIAAGGGRFLGF